jgi:CubicO group peptidase (beta-lactamase class C family)
MPSGDHMKQALRTMSAVVATVVLAAVSAFGAVAASDDEPDLQRRVTEFVGLVPGGAAATTVRDGVMSSASAGLLDDRGGVVEPGSPFHVGFIGTTLDTIVALQLVDEGRVELDAPVHTYLPDAPVAADATVRQLLAMRVGVPDNYGQLIGMSMEDPDRRWTPATIMEIVAAGDTGPAGELLPSIGTSAILSSLIEAVEGTDRATVLERRMVEPLGLSATGLVGGDEPAPLGMAQGWELGLGFVGDPDQAGHAMRSLDPVISSAPDVAVILQALAGGRLLSEESMDLVFDEEAVFFGIGFDTHEMVFGDLGDLGRLYFPVFSGIASGYASTMAVDPVSGDLVVALTNSADLDATELVRDIVSDWAAGE